MWRKCGKHHLIFFLVLYPVSGHLILGYRSNELKVKNNRSSEAKEKEINNFITSLHYNPNEVLYYKTHSVIKAKNEGQLYNDGTFVVISRDRKTITNEKADIGINSSNQKRTFPGSLLLANYHLIDNAPDYLLVQRAPVIYAINLPGMTSCGYFRIVPTFTNYEEAINNVLEIWFEKYSQNFSFNALLKSDYSFAYSKDQLRVKFGSEFKLTVVEANVDFDAVDKQEKLIMIHKFQQIFYTVRVHSPRTPVSVAKLFGEGVTREELASRINNHNPPIIVDSVSYGRVIYVTIETTSTDKEARAFMEAKLTKINAGIEAETDYSQRLKNFNMQVYVMGGGSDHIVLVNANHLKDVNDVIVKYSKLSRKNLGYPISYSIKFIQDNSKAVLKISADYTESTRKETKGGLIKVSHKGWFVSQWDIKWDEVSYDEHGNKKVKRKSWEKNWKNIYAPFDGEIQLKGNCENVYAYAREATGIPWDWWRTIFERSHLTLHKTMVFSISGPKLSPKYSVELID